MANQRGSSRSAAASPAPPADEAAAPAHHEAVGGGGRFQVTLIGVADKDRDLLVEELAQLGDIEDQQSEGDAPHGVG